MRNQCLALSTLRFRDHADIMKEGIPTPKVFVSPLFTYRGRDYLHINKLIVVYDKKFVGPLGIVQ